MAGLVLLVLLLLILLVVVPVYPYSRRWGYVPTAVVLALIFLWALLVWLGAIAVIWPWGTPAPPAAA